MRYIAPPPSATVRELRQTAKLALQVAQGLSGAAQKDARVYARSLVRRARHLEQTHEKSVKKQQAADVLAERRHPDDR